MIYFLRPGARAKENIMAAKTPASRTIRAPRGGRLRTKGWSQEGALRMLMNNLDREVAEKPADLIVYGGAGKAARNWDCYLEIVEASRTWRTTKPCSSSRENRWASSRPIPKPRGS